MTKYPRYQDYVIKNGRLIGEFEDMYRDFSDPWDQSTRESFSAEKSLALNAIAALQPSSVVELGCGLGHFTKRIRALNVPKVTGIDISETAVKRATELAPDCQFAKGDILDFSLLEKTNPEVIVMAEITWYILDRLEPFLEYLREKRPNCYLIHLLNVYPTGEQKYGADHFTDLQGILRYFGMNYVEYGEITKLTHGGVRRTYFLGRYAPLSNDLRL